MHYNITCSKNYLIKKIIPTLAGRYTPTLVLHPKNPLCHDDAKEPSRPVGYIKEPFLIQKNPTPSKEPLVSQKNHRGSLRAAKEPSFLRVYCNICVLLPEINSYLL